MKSRTRTTVSLAILTIVTIAAAVLFWVRPWVTTTRTAHASPLSEGRDPSPGAVINVVSAPRARTNVAVAPPSLADAAAPTNAESFRPVLDRVICKVSDAGVPYCGSCKVHEDCKRDEACTISPKTLLLECIAGNCKQDTDCGGDEVCRAVIEDGTVKRCVAPGGRYQGERCHPYAQDPAKQCQEGLVCVDQFCQTPCDKTNPASCKEGTHCTDTREGPACEADSCTKIGCPEGNTCLTLGDAKPHCFEGAVGDNCFLHPCPKGEACVAADGMKADTIAFQCRKACDPMTPSSCPKGFVCGRGGAADGAPACFKKCDPPHGLTCDFVKAGEICRTIDETLNLSGCVKDPEAPASPSRHPK
jgi:hypothetical protein